MAVALPSPWDRVAAPTTTLAEDVALSILHINSCNTAEESFGFLKNNFYLIQQWRSYYLHTATKPPSLIAHGKKHTVRTPRCPPPPHAAFRPPNLYESSAQLSRTRPPAAQRSRALTRPSAQPPPPRHHHRQHRLRPASKPLSRASRVSHSATAHRFFRRRTSIRGGSSGGRSRALRSSKNWRGRYLMMRL